MLTLTIILMLIACGACGYLIATLEEHDYDSDGDYWLNSKTHDCGCTTYGADDDLDYCPEHGTPPADVDTDHLVKS